jgi:hypothetical protein
MGRLANAELRDAKRKFNTAMAPIIQAAGRRRAFEWLCKAMSVLPQDCDAHRFDLAQCIQATDLCLQHLPPFLKES